VETVAHLEMTRLCTASNETEGTPPGACIVFIVDESRSMVTEHQWLMEFSQILEDELNKAGNLWYPQFSQVAFSMSVLRYWTW